MRFPLYAPSFVLPSLAQPRVLPRSASEALRDGVRLSVLRLGKLLPLVLLSWAPAELARVLSLVLDLSRTGRSVALFLSLVLSVLGAGFLSAALVSCLSRPHLQRAFLLLSAVRRMSAVLRTQLLLLALLGLLLLPLGVGLYVKLCHSQRFSHPGLDLMVLFGFIATALSLSFLGLRLCLAMIAAAADESDGVCALRRSALLATGRTEDLLRFALLVFLWMAPLIVLSLGWMLFSPGGHLALGYGVSLCISFLSVLQGQGAACGLTLLYADACADSGVPTRLSHLARRSQA